MIFASGNGSNFQAILEAIDKQTLQAKIVGLVCDQADAFCLTRAINHKVPYVVLKRSEYASKALMDEAILKQCLAWQADWLILAGYMRILTSVLIQAYPKRIINIHPSLLPKYKGKDALGQALAQHETTVGISIHYVDEGMDTGALITQVPFQIQPDQSRATIEHTLHQLEHEVYPLTIARLIKENP